MTQGIVGRIIKFDTELLRKGYVRVEGGGCIQVTKAGPHLRHFLSIITITCNDILLNKQLLLSFIALVQGLHSLISDFGNN